MTVHEMKLMNEPFLKIKNGSKTIEMRLNDDKRRLIKVDDIIEFKNIKTEETLKVKVKNLFTYPNFETLYANHDKISIGYNLDEIASPTDMLEYYKMENIKKYGVLAIQIELI